MRIDRRAPGEHELLGARRALVAEQAVTAQHGVLHDRQLHQLDESAVPLGAGRDIEQRAGQLVLGGDPGGDLGVVAVLQPAVRVGDGDAVIGVDDVLSPGRRDGGRQRSSWRDEGLLAQPRPRLGRLPWFALERRIRALRFLVFFDIGRQSLRAVSRRSASIAATSAGSSGSTIGEKRVTEPSLPTRNFSKFQRMSPLWPSASATAVSSA